MRLKPAEMAAALAKADPAVRLYLLAGEDEAASRAMAKSFERGMGPDAERIDLDSATLRADPARLADEAASISLFGGARWIRVTVAGAGDDILDAVDGLLSAEVAGNPVLILAGALTKANKLLKRADGASAARACLSYMPEARDIGGIVTELARAEHLRVSPDIARTIGGMVSNDRALIANELAKIALYLDARAGHPAEVTPDVLARLGAETLEEDIGQAIDVTLGGQARMLQPMLTRIDTTGVNEIRLIRALAIRVQLLASLRVDVEAGTPPARVVEGARNVFWKDKPALKTQLALWDAAQLARILERLYETEQAIKAPGTAGGVLLRQLLAEIVRLGARGR